MKKFLVMSMLSTLPLSAYEFANNMHRYILANYHQFGNNLTTAEKWYRQIAPEQYSPYIYYGYIPYLYSCQQYRQIVNLIPEVESYFKNNTALQMIFADAFLQINDKEEGHKRLILLHEQNKANQELTFRVVQIYVERKELENALLVIDNLLNNSPRRPNNYIFLFVKCQIYLQLNKKEDALNTLQACIDTYPKFDKSWLLYAMLQEQQGKIQEAIKGYTRFLEVTTEKTAEVEQHLLQLAFKQKLIPHAPPDDTQTRLLKIQTLAYDRNYDAALTLVKEWVIKDTGNAALWLRVLHLMCSIGLPVPRALTTIQELEKKIGANELLALYHADYALRLTDIPQMLAALAQAYTATSDATIKARILFQQARIHYEKNDTRSFEGVAAQAYTLGTDFAPLLNLIAYSDATLGTNLERAQACIGKALQQDVLNISYKDTQALIWSKKQQYDQAIALLEEIEPRCTDNCIILGRLGELHLKKGSREKATHYLKLASAKTNSVQEKRKIDTLLQEINN